jgi:RND family efflux transporter MFP subunit
VTGGRFLFLFLLILAAAAAGGGWYWLSAPAVETARPMRGPAVQAVYATGVVEPVNWAKVTPLTRGRIAEICLCENRTVKKGDVLARLDDREARAQLAELNARREFLASEVERYRQLIERRVVSAQAYERTVSEFGQVRAAIAAANERLDNLILRAPLDGVVLRKDGEVGEVAEPGQVLFWVGQPRPLWIVAEVDEEDIPRVKTGQRTLIKADAFPDRALDGRVDRITPKGDPVNKNYRVRIALPADTPLMIGMTTEVNIVIRRKENALLVPAEAVREGRVWQVVDGRAVPRRVETGVHGGNRIEIVGGLDETARILVAPPAGLAEGARVRARAATP